MIIEIKNLQAADCARVEPRLRRCAEPLIIKGHVDFRYTADASKALPSLHLHVNGDQLYKHSSIVAKVLADELILVVPPPPTPTRRERLDDVGKALVAFVRA